MKFKKVIGQEPAKSGLLQMWKNNSFPHALLITGAEGTGGLPMALALAQYIFCENKTDEDSCGQCSGCSKVSRLEHADLHFSFPTISPRAGVKPPSRAYFQEFREFVQQTPYGTTYDWLQFINAENKQGNITADECREIIETLYLRSYEGGKKVLVMWRPEYLGKEGNILLKLIEEPPDDTIMILVAENRDQIISTILSRTQEVRLVPLRTEEIAAALMQREQAAEFQANQAAQMSGGSYTEALRLLRETGNDLFPQLRQLFNVVFLHNGVGISALADEWSKAGREQQKNFLQYVSQMMEHAVKAQYMQDQPIRLPATEAEFVKKLATRNLPVDIASKMIQQISQTSYYIERNAHGKTQFHALFIALSYIVNGREMPC